MALTVKRVAPFAVYLVPRLLLLLLLLLLSARTSVCLPIPIAIQERWIEVGRDQGRGERGREGGRSGRPLAKKEREMEKC